MSAEEVGPGVGRTAHPDMAVVTERIAALDRHVASEFANLKELLTSQRNDDKQAIATAMSASQELASKHNDLIRQQEKKDATYATKDELLTLFEGRDKELDRLSAWQNKLVGGLFVVGAVGVANLVKIWTG